MPPIPRAWSQMTNPERGHALVELILLGRPLLVSGPPPVARKPAATKGAEGDGPTELEDPSTDHLCVAELLNVEPLALVRFMGGPDFAEVYGALSPVLATAKQRHAALTSAAVVLNVVAETGSKASMGAKDGVKILNDAASGGTDDPLADIGDQAVTQAVEVIKEHGWKLKE